MRILILALNYLPESTSIGPYTADLAEHLAGNGNQVHVVTAFPSAPEWKIWPAYRRRLYMSETIRGVKIWRTYIYVPSNPSRAFQRVLFDLSFSVSSLIGALSSGPCDVVLAVSPPLQLGFAGWLTSRYRSASFMLHVQDIVSEAAVATGSLKPHGPASRIAGTMERFLYKHADAIGVICEGFRRIISRCGADPLKIRVLPNYVDLDFIKPCERANEFRRQHGLSSSDFLLVYSGSISLKQGLETLIEAARFISDPTIKILIIGAGVRLQAIRNLASDLRLNNVLFLPLQSRESLPAQLGAADLLVITQKHTVKDVVFPGKLLYYMAAQRPVLAIVHPESETGRFVAAERVGAVVPPDNSEAVARAIMQLRPQSLTEFGRNARNAAERYFDKRVVLPEFDAVLEGLARR